MTFCINIGGAVCSIIVEEKAFEGVKRIADTLAEDVKCVCGVKPHCITGYPEKLSGYTIVAATVDSSPFLDSIESRINLDALRGKRECYGYFFLDAKDISAGEGKVLVIAGSDKRGTIYGLLNISEKCGVSPFIYWGDVKPEHKDDVVIEITDGFISKEPSVEYRGLFINDELPAFGNWAIEKFGGANSAAYDEVFKLILRLKGNYMWPAMWFEVFSEDGPGTKNAELADIYGIVMGTSHHEPLCRAGAEWQRIYKQYGDDNTWSFVKNGEAISNFWKDGLIRNREFENIITIGMRGEDDSLLLGEDATLEDNINVLKTAIIEQYRLLKENVSPDLKEINRMLAIYKEVEDFYYGDENTQGLKDWDQLEDVIFLLSDDNFANTRGLPTPEDRNHKGGFGMYYHFDYHGAPISYECVNCTILPKVWDQMTLAYDSGVRKLWIVNVGDIKFNELPLSYFMDLAYDYEKWSVPNLTDKYLKEFVYKNFGESVSDGKKQEIIEFVELFTRMNSCVHPETLHADSFAPEAFNETKRMISVAREIISLGNSVRESIEKDAKIAFESLFYYQGMVSAYSMLAGLYSGMNRFLAGRGALRANDYIPMIEEMIDKDKALVKEFHSFLNGKWNYMLASAHTGFNNWNDDIWNYPTSTKVYPLDRKAVLFSFEDSSVFHTGSMWTDSKKLESYVLADSNLEETSLFIDLKAPYDFDYKIVCEDKNISLSTTSGHFNSALKNCLEVKISADRNKIKEKGYADISVELDFAEKVSPCDNTVIKDKVRVYYGPFESGSELFIHKSSSGMIVIPAGDYASAGESEDGSFILVNGLGVVHNAVKAVPFDKSYYGLEKKPYLEYLFDIDMSGEYKLDFYTLGRNPVVMGDEMRFEISVNDGATVTVTPCDKSYKTHFTNSLWSRNVMTGINVASTGVNLQKGTCSLKVFAGDQNIAIEKIVVYPAAFKVPFSRLGPCFKGEFNER
ncbi:MAG: glycosyl hydrolase 115 family protein [Lachnospiraceae bacterium]|nr:glycosyl hydrolase 115 family protein [Lachnospiraceae bacterium]